MAWAKIPSAPEEICETKPKRTKPAQLRWLHRLRDNVGHDPPCVHRPCVNGSVHRVWLVWFGESPAGAQQRAVVGTAALPSTLCEQTSSLDVGAWQLCNEETVGVNQQQGFACAVPMAPTKERCTKQLSLPR